LFGRHLRKGDADAGADIDFARVERDRAVRVNRELAVDFALIDWSAGLREQVARHGAKGKTHDDRTAGLQSVATRDLHGYTSEAR
jgi:hypothetical protein